MTSRRISRRAFLWSATAAVGAGCALGLDRIVLRGSDEPAGALTEERRHTYAALVATVAASAGCAADRDYVRGATADFGEWYARHAESIRHTVDPVLDTFAGDGGEPFAAMQPQRRIAMLAAWREDADPAPDRHFATRGERHRVAVAKALALASCPFDPDTVEHYVVPPATT